MKTILVVDDEPSMRHVIEDALSDDYNVVNVTNGREAWDRLAENKYDLVITDLVMPEMNGIDLVMGIRKTYPDQKLIIISGGGGIQGRFDYLPVAQLIAGCTAMRKPFPITELRDAVKKMFE
jgi:DNA-binding NtrC family response regulator